MSNHFHLILTDVLGTLPRFMQDFDQLLARALNVRYDRCEAFWAVGTYSSVELLTSSAVWAEMIYCITNPVRAGLVSRARRWPGVVSLPKHFGKQEVITRPKGFFREEGPLPAEATLELKVPACLETDLDTFKKRLGDAVAEEEKKIQAKMRAQGRKFAGRRAVLAQDPMAAPKTRAPRGRLKPRLAARNPAELAAGIARMKAFWQEYREAYDAFRKGNRAVLFPAGTYWLRLHLNVACAAPT